MRDREYREDEKRTTPLAEMGYETEDLEPVKFAKGILVLFLFVLGCAVAAVIVVLLMSPGKLVGPPVSETAARSFPQDPAPLLQSNITKQTDMMDQRRQETAKLRSYGVVDAPRNVYRIPIGVAKEKLVQQGLPKTPPAPAREPGQREEGQE